jgi:short subunit dehydrogenase-like uncharacterized protein
MCLSVSRDAMAKEAREVHDEQLKEFHGYVSMYQEREGTVGASGGTLSTRAAMASGDAWVRKVMTDPFALGGSVENGQREEDQDRVLTKVFRDGAIKSWVAPHVYAFFETRVVRRSNELHRTLVGGPDKGPFYGEKLNVTVYTLMPSARPASCLHAIDASPQLSRRRGRREGVQEVREHLDQGRRRTIEKGGQVLRAGRGASARRSLRDWRL